MKLQRCQLNEISTSTDFQTDTTGCVGTGIYAMLFGDKKLRKFYSSRGESCYTFEVSDQLVKEVKGLGLTTYQAIRERIAMLEEEGYRVFIFKHGGINVPKGKQVIILDHEVIRNIQKL